MSHLLSLDATVSHAISSLAGWLPLDLVMAAASLVGLRGAIWLLLGLFLVVRRGAPAAEGFVRLGWALGLAFLLTESLLKPMIARPRPDFSSQVRPAIIELATARTEGYSFPSGHAMSAAAGAYALALMWPRRRRWIWALGLLIAASRVYLGVHYAVDVAVGFALGIGVGYFATGGSPCYISGSADLSRNTVT
jgi:undecaprenyl-diphosphatase